MKTTPDLHLKNALLVDLSSGDTRQTDIRITDGMITAIEAEMDGGETPVYDCTNKMVSPGWMDMHVHLREPGFEYKETIETGCDAAAFGGFTAVACMPNTDPPIHTRDVVEFIVDRAERLPVDVYPIACVSKKREGKSLAEMADMKAGGAVGFSDDGSPVYDAGLMRRALEYASMLDVPIVNHMEEPSLNVDGHMHEGSVATRLGIPGISALSEEVMIARDVLLAEFTGGAVHVAHISTARAVDIVRRARECGIPVTAEVCTHHFTLTDEAVETMAFSTNTKMHPPLRSRSDVDAIKNGLKDGTIDAICTDHAPHASFEKDVEYLAAPFGIIGLETAWGLICRELVATGVLSLTDAIQKITVAPREILNIPVPRVEVGQPACLTIFDDSTSWVFSEQSIRSKSKNSPFLGEKLVGKAWAIYNKGTFVEND
jgi:dihydroorotase